MNVKTYSSTSVRHPRNTSKSFIYEEMKCQEDSETSLCSSQSENLGLQCQQTGTTDFSPRYINYIESNNLIIMYNQRVSFED